MSLRSNGTLERRSNGTFDSGTFFFVNRLCKNRDS